MITVLKQGLSGLSPALECLPVLPKVPPQSLLFHPLFRLLSLSRDDLLFNLLVPVLLLLLLFHLPLPLDELPLVLLHLRHALVVLLVLEAAESLTALHAREMPGTPTPCLAMLVHLLFLEGRVAGLAIKCHHSFIYYYYYYYWK